MALTEVKLKDNVFLTLDDVKDWVKVPLEDKKQDTRLARILNMCTDMCERYLDAPIKIREVTEFKDGDSSNVIVPNLYPAREIIDLRVDFNRSFDDATQIFKENFILRGATDLDGRIKGTDIVLRDDNNTSIIGRIFTGSVAGAIKLTYKAGWGNDQNDIPGDICQAVLLAVEYYYRLRDSADIGIKSKTNNNQGYTRDASGLPQEVKDLLDEYKDYAIGGTNTPQKNTFVI